MYYIYDEQTKQFNGMTQGQKNPKREGFLQPANSTSVAPPAEFSVNEVPVYNIISGAWELKVSQYKKDLDKALINEVNGYGVKLNEEVDGAVVPKAQNVVDTETDNIILVQNEKELEEQKQNLKNMMNYNIEIKARLITGGSSLESIQAFMSAFSLRAFSPSLYANEGLVVYYAIEGYTKGEALDTEFKITDYYTKVLVEIDLYRNAEINTYLQALTNL